MYTRRTTPSCNGAGLQPCNVTDHSSNPTINHRPWLSIIIPARNEANLIAATIKRALTAEGTQIIVVDGDSQDDTAQIAQTSGATVLSCPPGRARQMNHGAAHATGKVLLFLHADTRLPRRYDNTIRELLRQPKVVAGAFRLRIGAASPSLRLIAAAANLRSSLLGMPYGDQALFVTADTFTRLGGLPDLPVMEDYEFVRRLKRLGKIRISDVAVETSARRWRSQGVWRVTMLHQLMILGYHLGISPHHIASWRAKSSSTADARCHDASLPA